MDQHHAVDLSEMTIEQYERWQTLDRSFARLRAAHASGATEDALAASIEGAQSAFAFRAIYRANEK